MKKKMPQQIDDYENYEIPAGNSSFLKIDAKGTRIRLCSKPLELRLHNTTAGGKYTTSPCKGDGCELCEKFSPLIFKYAYLTLNKGDNKVYIFEAPLTVFRLIVSYATNKEYWDPTKYDLTISKSGEGKKTVYSVIASPKQSELTEAEKDLILNSNLSLDDVYTEKKSEWGGTGAGTPQSLSPSKKGGE